MREAYFSFRSVPCILIKVSVGGKSSRTTRLLPFSCFVGIGLLTHPECQRAQSRARHTHKNSTAPPSSSSFPQPRLQKDKGGIYTLHLYPHPTTPSWHCNQWAFSWHQSAHILHFRSRAIDSVWKRTLCWKQLCGLCGSDRRDVFSY